MDRRQSGPGRGKRLVKGIGAVLDILTGGKE